MSAHLNLPKNFSQSLQPDAETRDGRVSSGVGSQCRGRSKQAQRVPQELLNAGFRCIFVGLGNIATEELHEEWSRRSRSNRRRQRCAVLLQPASAAEKHCGGRKSRTKGWGESRKSAVDEAVFELEYEAIPTTRAICFHATEINVRHWKLQQEARPLYSWHCVDGNLRRVSVGYICYIWGRKKRTSNASAPAARLVVESAGAFSRWLWRAVCEYMCDLSGSWQPFI